MVCMHLSRKSHLNESKAFSKSTARRIPGTILNLVYIRMSSIIRILFHMNLFSSNLFLCPASNLAGTAEIVHHWWNNWTGLPWSIASNRLNTVLLLFWRICSENVKEEGLSFTATKCGSDIYVRLRARHWPVLTAAHCQLVRYLRAAWRTTQSWQYKQKSFTNIMASSGTFWNNIVASKLLEGFTITFTEDGSIFTCRRATAAVAGLFTYDAQNGPVFLCAHACVLEIP